MLHVLHLTVSSPSFFLDALWNSSPRPHIPQAELFINRAFLATISTKNILSGSVQSADFNLIFDFSLCKKQLPSVLIRVCQIEIMFYYIPGSCVKFSPWGLWMKCDYYFWDIFLFRPCPRYSKFNMGFKWENLEISQNPPRGWNIGFIMLFQTPLHSLGSKMGG